MIFIDYDDAHSESTSSEEPVSFKSKSFAVRSQMRIASHSSLWHGTLQMDMAPHVYKALYLQRERYGYLRNLALQKLRADINKMLAIASSGIICHIDSELVPEKFFSWQRKDFIKRQVGKYQRQKLVLFLNAIHNKAYSIDELEKYYLKYMYHEVSRFIEYIFESIQIDDYCTEDGKNVLAFMQDMKDFLNIEQELADHVNLHVVNVRKLRGLLLGCSGSHSLNAAMLEEKCANYAIMDPIQLRYKMNYIITEENVREQTFQMAEKDLKKEIRHWHSLTMKENICFNCTMDTIYNQNEYLKRSISDMATKYEQDSAKIDDRNEYLSKMIDKLKRQVKFCQEQLDRFHEEIEVSIMDEMRRTEAEAVLRAEQEEKLLRMQRNKKKKRLSKSLQMKNKGQRGSKPRPSKT